MQKRILVLLFSLTFLAFGCAERGSTPLAPTEQEGIGVDADVQAQALALVEQAEWAVEASQSELDQALVDGITKTPAPLFNFKRTVIAGDVVHYSITVRTGPGPYDKIGIHRVVRESRRNRPIRTHKAFFMLHGDLKRFETMFIPGQFSSHLPDDFGIAVFLAQNDVDVWGIDQGWNFVPREESDFSFFADWGIQKEVDHLEIGLGIARTVRLLTGNGLGKMLLLGYSSGSATGYACLNQESQWPTWRRQVKGFIAADMGVRSDDPDFLAMGAGLVELYSGLHDAGQYEDPIYIFPDVAMLARTDPDGDSPVIPGLKNLQTALFFGGGPIFAPSAAHYHAPVLEDGLPVDFQFVTIDQWLDFITAAASYEPTQFELDYSRMLAGLPSPFLDHLGDIKVPIFDLGGAGGIAPYTAATLSYLGSSDITHLYVSVGAAETALDYGHIDIFTGSNAPALVWQPVLDWIVAHSNSLMASTSEEAAK